MIYAAVAFATLIGAAEAFNVGAVAARASRSAVSMQVAEAEVASPVALAKVRIAFVDFAILRLLLLVNANDAAIRPSAQAADEARGLAIDSISKAHSGHMGLPLGCAEIGAVLFGQEMYARPALPALPRLSWRRVSPCNPRRLQRQSLGHRGRGALPALQCGPHSC